MLNIRSELRPAVQSPSLSRLDNSVSSTFLNNSMLFIIKEERPKPSLEVYDVWNMEHGTYDVWHMSSNRNPFERHVCHNPYEKGNNVGPYPQQLWFFIGSMEQDMWQHRAHKPHWICFGRKHGLGHQEINPLNFHEMFNKMRERSREHCPRCKPVSRRYGKYINYILFIYT